MRKLRRFVLLEKSPGVFTVEVPEEPVPLYVEAVSEGVWLWALVREYAKGRVLVRVVLLEEGEGRVELEEVPFRFLGRVYVSSLGVSAGRLAFFQQPSDVAAVSLRGAPTVLSGTVESKDELPVLGDARDRRFKPKR